VWPKRQSVVDEERPGGQVAQVGELCRRELLRAPEGGLARVRVERVHGHEAAHGLVMVAAHDHVRRERADTVDHRAGVGAVANEVAEYEHAVVRRRRAGGKDCRQGREVAVDVAEDQVAHGLVSGLTSAADEMNGVQILPRLRRET
jgi:hypothetical protein